MPTKIRRVVLTAPHEDITKAKIEIEEVDMPKPRMGEVLIKVTAAPVNPSDYGEWSNVIVGKEFKPTAVGKEGSGIVVASGGGVYANSIVGCKVGFVTNVTGQGSYAEFCTVNALEGTFPLPASVPVENAASHFVNPYTACGFLDLVKTRHRSTKHRPAMVQTAAASQLGQMLVKLCKQEDVTLINVVRRQDQADILKAIGVSADHIIISSDSDWKEKLGAAIKTHGVEIGFDAVAGDMSGTLLDALPPKGTLFVYGRLSNEGCSGIQPLDLIYRQKKLEGFYLGSWIKAGGPLAMLQRIRAATALVHAGLQDENGWAASQFADCSVDDMWTNFVKMWKENGFTNKKLRIRFDSAASE
jgi:NADPH:quinone reductase